jgi:hypothetical protein
MEESGIVSSITPLRRLNSETCNNVRSIMERVMKKAVWNGQTIAESEYTKLPDGVTFFPEETVKREFLRPSSLHLPGGKKFVMESVGNRATTPYVRAVWLNGDTFNKPSIEHSAITKGGTLAFAMSAEASKFPG